MVPMRTGLILRIILTPVGGLVGFIAGVLAAMALGLNLYDNYEYFTPFPASPAIPTMIGMFLCYGGAAIGTALPWISLRYPGREAKAPCPGPEGHTCWEPEQSRGTNGVPTRIDT
jgi:hypothetical protein